ncbi:MAG: CHAT domain-containing protein [Bryobacterales bacterium]|nr:CHAT domain-containing protein [Bryobacterales bacterium]
MGRGTRKTWFFFLLISGLAGCKRPAHPPSLQQCIADVDSRKLTHYGSALEQAERCLALAAPHEKALARVTYLEVLSLRGQWKAILSESVPSDAPDPRVAARWRILHGLASIRTGDPTRGVQLLNQVREEARRHNWPDLEVRTLVYLGGRGQNFDEETAHLREAIPLLRKNPNPQLETYVHGQMGMQYLRAERCGEAVEWLEQALAAAQKANDTVNRARTVGNLGWCYLVLGETETGLALSKEASQLADRTDNVGDQIKWRNNAGAAAFLLNRYPEAAGFYQDAYRIIEASGRNNDAADCLNNLATLYLASGDPAKAHEAQQRAKKLLDPNDQRSRFFSDVTEANLLVATKDFAAAEKRINGLLKSNEAEQYQRLGIREIQAELFIHTNRRAQAAIEYQRGLREAMARGNDLQREDFRLSYPSTNLSLFRRYSECLLEDGRVVDALWVADAARWSKFGDAAFSLPAVDPRTIAAKRGATILVYWLRPARSSLWVVTTSAVRHHELPGEQEIAKLIEQHNTELKNSAQQAKAGLALYRMLVGDRVDAADLRKRVIVIGDGVLHRLSFDTLTPRAGCYWIEDTALSRAPSLRSLLETTAARPQTGKMLLVGNADLASSGFPELPRAKEELTDIVKEIGGRDVTVLSENDANPRRVLNSGLEQFAYLHFAAHGLASERTPLDSALVLSPSNGDRRLTAREIIRQKLRARLVTLGVCHGAGVRAYRGTGLIGLGWAFLRAGAEGVAAGLWEINDSASLRVHTTMYRLIRQGTPAPEALRQARLDLLRSDTPFRKPYYWGAWTYMEGRP